MLLDYRGWAFDNSAQAIAKELSTKYNFDFKYINDKPKPKINHKKYNLIYVFFWGEKYHTNFYIPVNKIIKEVSSHRWIDDERFGPCSTKDMVQKYLNDAATVICTSKRLVNEIKPHHDRVFHTPNGISTEKFYYENQRSGSIQLGWAGNINDNVKGYKEIVEPVCKNNYNVLIALGNVSHEQMNEFYNKLDVLIISSKHEGEPLTLLEAMAAGCFPVCTDVGIVPELIVHKKNGYIVKTRKQEAFLEAFKWCEENLEFVRQQGIQNSEYIKQERAWNKTIKYFDEVFSNALNL